MSFKCPLTAVATAIHQFNLTDMLCYQLLIIIIIDLLDYSKNDPICSQIHQVC